MQCAVITAPYKVEVQERPLPHVASGEVRVRVLQVGVCASDMQVYHGKHAYMTYPVIQGHEGVGVVDRVGADVSGLAEGDFVAVQPQFFCGTCFACRHGRINVCERLRFLGVTRDGLFAQYVTLPAWNAVKLNGAVTRDMAMLIEPLAVGVNAVRVVDVGEGDNVVVVGAGTIGNFTAQVAKALGARVLISDIQDEKLDLARDHGVDYAFNTSRIALLDAIRQCFGSDAPRVIIDCVALPQVLDDVIASAANATEIVIVGNYKQPVLLEIPKLQRREIFLKSVMAYNREHFLEAAALLAEGKIRTDGMVTARFPLQSLTEAYQYIDDHPDSCMRVAVELT